jgi:hypothetical protein
MGKTNWKHLGSNRELDNESLHFWHESDIPRHGNISSCNAILKWVDDFNVRGSAVNKSVGPAHPSGTPQKAVDNDNRVLDV